MSKRKRKTCKNTSNEQTLSSYKKIEKLLLIFKVIML